MPSNNAQPRATIVPVPLVGEPETDSAFKNADDALTYRVRVVEVANASAAVTTHDTSAIAPFLRAFDVTITWLDDHGKPKRDAAGNVVIAANTRWTLTPESAAAEDPRLTLRRLVEQLIWSASQVHVAQAAIDAIATNWSAAIGASASVSVSTTTKLQ